MSFRVEVDRGLCQGHGVCESEAPAVFSVSKKGDLTILDPNQPRFSGASRAESGLTPPAELRARVELAVRYCPTHALSIIELEGDE